MHAGRWLDRTISIAGLSATVVPEFVSSIVLILVFGVWLRWLPIEASYPPEASALEQLRHLVLPVLPLVLVFFGYIARMARAGTVEALDADYTRTAILKGLPRRIVIWRHVLRNALLPTITVAATQLGYMIGGLVVVETLFHYQGIGSLIYNAAKAKDFPMLEAGVLTIGVVYTVANLVADALHVAAQSAAAGEERRMSTIVPPTPRVDCRAALRPVARAAALAHVRGRRGDRRVVGRLRARRAVDRAASIRTRPIRSTRSRRPTAAHWFGTDQLGRDVFSRVIVGARDILTIAPLATLLGTVAGTAVGLIVGYFEGWVDNVVGRAIDAVLALPLVIVALLALAAVGASNFTVILVIGITFTPITARTVRAAVFAERHLDYVPRRNCAANARPTSCSPRFCRTCCRRSSSKRRCGSVTRSSRSPRCRFSASAFSRRRPTGVSRCPSRYTLMAGGAWWTVVFAAGAIATPGGRRESDRRQRARRARPMNGPPPSSFPAFDVSKSDRTDALTVVGLTVTYRMRGRDREVLQDISFRVRRGEAYGLVGESGCGKSTVAMAALRYLPRNGR